MKASQAQAGPPAAAERSQAAGGHVVTAVDSVPVTRQHDVQALEGLADKIHNPGLPRANITCDAEHPEGTYQPPNMTVLQQHVAFWDRDSNGLITPADVYVGFRRLGFNVFLSGIAPLIINGTFSWWTQSSWIPDPLMRIQMGNIHRGKHGSDSEVYDTEGRFVPQKFEEIFSKYDKGNKGGLTLQEVQDMIRGNRNIFDPTGWIAGWLEWNVTYYMCAKDTPRGRLLMKDDARAAIDGTLFYRVAQEVEAGRLKMRQTKGGMDRTDRRPAGTAAAQKAE
ncbi:caleosin domain containing [Chlorella sorokiniana]|uniref:Caleosin domain containing n=1 Tax=Chlorella sorokiniana TaxID=3076 RepID=A0A2P6TLZ1_CHLSO|nr:caleosin domain containing [Chlorella sorokiniana]|eukprot:PRW45357.1 caleosin domain containing [Chlorella sorokiniana]